MKKIFVIIILLFVSTSVFPQHRISVGLGYDIAIPIGDFRDIAKTGYSWTAIGEYPINPKFSVQLLSGYMKFPVDIEPIATGGNVITFDLESIPLRTGIKYFVIPDIFLVGEVGINFFKVSAAFQGAYGDPTKQSTNYQAQFSLGAGAGGVINLAERSLINITAKYIYVDRGDYSINFNHVLLGIGLLVHFNI